MEIDAWAQFFITTPFEEDSQPISFLLRKLYIGNFDSGVFPMKNKRSIDVSLLKETIDGQYAALKTNNDALELLTFVLKAIKQETEVQNLPNMFEFNIWKEQVCDKGHKTVSVQEDLTSVEIKWQENVFSSVKSFFGGQTETVNCS